MAAPEQKAGTDYKFWWIPARTHELLRASAMLMARSRELMGRARLQLRDSRLARRRRAASSAIREPLQQKTYSGPEPTLFRN